MKASFWIAWRELAGRKDRLITSIALFAVLVALCTTLELVSKSREVSLATEIDEIGPAIQLIPSGLTQTDLARLDTKGKFIEVGHEAELRARVSSWARIVETRLILSETIEGIETPVIGAERVIGKELAREGISLGALVAERLKKRVGDSVQLRDAQFPIIAVLASTGTADDLGVFIHRNRLQQLMEMPDAFNEIRMYLFPGRDAKHLAGILRRDFPNLSAILNDRGSVADQEANDSLQKHRFAVYVVILSILALSLLIGALLNGRERKGEMVTLIGIGGTRSFVFYTLLWRSVIVTLLGSIVGYTTGVLAAAAQDVPATFLLTESWGLLFLIMATAIAAGVLAVGPLVFVLGTGQQD